MNEKKQDEKKQAETKYERTLGRTLAREITNEELEAVVGGLADTDIHGTRTGDPCLDCD